MFNRNELRDALWKARSTRTWNCLNTDTFILHHKIWDRNKNAPWISHIFFISQSTKYDTQRINKQQYSFPFKLCIHSHEIVIHPNTWMPITETTGQTCLLQDVIYCRITFVSLFNMSRTYFVIPNRKSLLEMHTTFPNNTNKYIVQFYASQVGRVAQSV
jgi:hypothetical protein